MKTLEPILEIKNLKLGYKNAEPLLTGASLRADEGELISLVGKNGIGKSTLLRTISRLHEPMDGNVFLSNKDINTFNRYELAKTLSFVSTEIVKVNNLKVFDLVALGRFPYTNWIGKLLNEDILKCIWALEMVGLDHLRNKNIDEISDGERQRAMLARTLAQDTKIIILDEPTAFLDLPNKYEIVHLLNKLAREDNKTIIFSTHDLNIAIKESDKIWILNNDTITEGAPEDLILSESFNSLFEHTNLNFDKHKGDFSLKKSASTKILLEGDNDTFLFWTKKALERLNFQVSKSKNIATKVIITKENSLVKWLLINKDNSFQFDSIYDLSVYLKVQTKI
jgi:iron complex transport system ATP-binding protein